MQITISAKQMLKVLYVLSWIIFIGLCFEACAIIIHVILTFSLDPADVKHLWRPVDLSSVYQYDHGQFYVVTIYIIIVAVLKAIMFYLIVKISGSKNTQLSGPFTNDVRAFISHLSYLALGIGLFSDWGTRYCAWLTTHGVEMPDMQSLGLGGADVWLFMGVTLLIIAQIFKRGIELQTENELTV